MRTGAQAELKREYRRNLEVGFLAALLAVFAAFMLYPRERPPTAARDSGPVVFFFPDESAETPEPVQAVEVPDVPVADVVEDVRDVETPFRDPLWTRQAVATPPLPAQSDEPLLDYDFAPRPRNIVRPDYPEAARVTNTEGTVRLRVIVGADGYVEDAKVLDTDFPPFGESALKAVFRWTFLPAMRAGRPVRASIVLPIEFVLTEGDGAE